MKNLKTFLYKDFLVMWRDREGLALLFLMPMILVFLMTWLQDSSIKTINESSINVLLINSDSGEASEGLISAFETMPFFKLHTKIDGEIPTIEEAKEEVKNGNYKFGIIIPSTLTESLKEEVLRMIEQQMPGLLKNRKEKINNQQKEIIIFFDPVIKESFRHALLGIIQESMLVAREQIMLSAYGKVLGAITQQKPKEISPENVKLLNIREEFAAEHISSSIPNSSQHNVPAWTIFAMFFIAIPLSGNFIREKDSGNIKRLSAMPVSYLQIVLSKVIVYAAVTFSQALFIFLLGKFILPLTGMPALNVGNCISGLIILTISISLAATGFGVVIGTVARTHSQAAVFGAVSVMILAALGGIWVPTYFFPEFMRILSAFSPLNWAITSYYELMLLDGCLIDIATRIFALIGFFLLTIFVAAYYRRKQNVL